MRKYENKFFYLDFLESIFKDINTGIILFDKREDEILYINNIIYKMFKMKGSLKKSKNNINYKQYKDDLFKLVLNQNKDINKNKLFKNIIKDNKSYKNHILEVTLNNGDNLYIYFTKKKLSIENKELIIILMTDITKIKKSEIKLNQKLKELNKKLKFAEIMASIDPLTQIFNRYKFYEECNKFINMFNRYGTIFSIIMFDIDNFKKINDNFGHLIGDSVLKEITNLVSNTIRNTDLFFRWGGDEFIVILPNTDLNGAFSGAEKLRKVISKYNFKNILKFKKFKNISDNKKKENIKQITCSFGVSEVKKGFDCDSLTKIIDEAMYSAKNKGKNKVVKL